MSLGGSIGGLAFYEDEQATTPLPDLQWGYYG